MKYKELPELDDDFAKDVSEYDTLDELKDSIRKNIEENNNKQADAQVENDLIEQVVNGMTVEVPEAMYEARVEELVQDFQYRIAQQGLKLEQYLQYMGMELDAFKLSSVNRPKSRSRCVWLWKPSSPRKPSRPPTRNSKTKSSASPMPTRWKWKRSAPLWMKPLSRPTCREQGHRLCEGEGQRHRRERGRFFREQGIKTNCDRYGAAAAVSVGLSQGSFSPGSQNKN